jgi:hypothetical protein
MKKPAVLAAGDATSDTVRRTKQLPFGIIGPNRATYGSKSADCLFECDCHADWLRALREPRGLLPNEAVSARVWGGGER